MRRHRTETIVKVYLVYATSLYLFIGLRFLFVVHAPASARLLVVGLIALLNTFNLLEVFTEDIVQYRLYLLPHFILSILLYIFTYPIAGIEYYIVSIHVLSILLFERRMAGYVEAFVVIMVVGVSRLYFIGSLTPDELLQEYTLYFVLCGSMTIMMGTLMRYRATIFELQQDRIRLEEVLTKMEVVNRQYRDHLVDVEADAMDRERKRITREIHDIVGHAMITNISMLERISSMIDNQEPAREVKKVVDTAYENATEGLEHSRILLYQFRNQIRRGMVGLVAIGQMVSIFRTATGVQVRQEYGDCPISFGEPIDGVLYHLIEESLVNSFRHGKATSVVVHVQVVDGRLEVDIQDDGVGASSFAEGIGLNGMRERISSLSGELAVRSNHRGFLVSARLPLAASTRRPGDGELPIVS